MNANLCTFRLTTYFMQTSDKDERLMCYIVNTAEYCHKTVGYFHTITMYNGLNLEFIHAGSLKNYRCKCYFCVRITAESGLAVLYRQIVYPVLNDNKWITMQVAWPCTFCIICGLQIWSLCKATLFFLHCQAGELAENVSKVVDTQYADKIDMSEVQVLVSSLRTSFCNVPLSLLGATSHNAAASCRMSSQQL